ncbi:MAG: DUF4175 family protein [Alphaproteobacteria bacterium]|nr:DUF4175 family protein [Alphaproteobacteria bacterium]
MTILSDRTDFPTGSADLLDRRIRVARAVVGVERLLPALWPALGFAGLYLAAALFGLFKYIPWEIQSLLLAAAVTAVALTLAQGLEQFVWPGAFDGARRLERDSGLSHRPISERDDILPDGRDPVTAALWQAHRARMAKLGALRMALPAADLSDRDPKGLRWYLLIVLVAALVVARGDIGPRLIRAFDSGNSASIDAWLDPPAYTGLPMTPLTLGDHDITIPAGSVLNLRVHGAPHAPGLSAGINPVRAFTGSDGDYASALALRYDGHVRVRVAGHLIGDWRVHAVPDAAPKIAFVGVPKRTEHNAVNFHFKGSDDYGVTGVAVILSPHGRANAPAVTVPLDGGGKSFDQTTYVDLTANPYAGLAVEARLEARDGAGQKTLSTPVTFTLPARIFTDPLARALIEQRQNLAAAANAAERAQVATMLDAFAIAPDKFYEGKRPIYMALRNAYFGIKSARAPSDITHVEDLLWQTAVALEQGGLANAAEELRRLQSLLAQAMANGAPQDQIDALLQRYNEAMQKYLEALAANPPPPGEARPDNPDAVTLGENDIQKMMDMIKKLSEAGQREMAAQMLALLQNMLENLRLTPGKGGGQGTAQNKALNDAMNKLGDTMGKQRGLLDKTFRQQQGRGDPKDGGPQGLANQQRQLQQQMQDAMKGVNPSLSQKMKDAGQAMQQSEDALRKGDLDNAKNAQQKALQSMSQAAQALADQAKKESGEASNGDPLGRARSDEGKSVKIPDADTLAKARAILEELRRRAGQMQRPQDERDYIDRLLKSF